MDASIAGSQLSGISGPTSESVTATDSIVVCDRSRVRIVLTNIRSIVNKRDELENLVESLSPSVVALTETWLTRDVEDSEVTLRGYKLFRNDRSIRGGGGVMLLVRDEYEAYLWQATSDPDGFYESLWCKVRLSHNGFDTIGVIYRSPGSQPSQMLSDIRTFSKGNHCLILGDFNAPSIDWSRNVCSINEPFTSELLSTTIDLYLYQHVSEPTRVTPSASNILDLVLSKNETDVHDVQILPPVGSSDNAVVSFTWKRGTHATPLSCKTKNV